MLVMPTLVLPILLLPIHRGMRIIRHAGQSHQGSIRQFIRNAQSSYSVSTCSSGIKNTRFICRKQESSFLFDRDSIRLLFLGFQISLEVTFIEPEASLLDAAQCARCDAVS